MYGRRGVVCWQHTTREWGGGGEAEEEEDPTGRPRDAHGARRRRVASRRRPMTRTAPSPHGPTTRLTFSYFLELLILLHIFADTTGGTRTHARTVAHSVFRTTARARRTLWRAIMPPTLRLVPRQALPTFAEFLPIEYDHGACDSGEVLSREEDQQRSGYKFRVHRFIKYRERFFIPS